MTDIPTLREEADRAVARSAVEHYGMPSARVELINVSENATFLITPVDPAVSTVLRVHRVGYHSPRAIESELDWMEALRTAGVVRTPRVLVNTAGERVTAVDIDGEVRHAVMFNLVPGTVKPDEDVSRSDFEMLGAITARMHLHSSHWTPSPAFTRFAWDWDHTLGSKARWGQWENGFGVGQREHVVLGGAAELIRDRLETYGKGPDRYGLIHADMRLANLLVDSNHRTVIDFDDCGYSWLMYDCGAAVSFLEHDARLPEWQDAWLRGYRTVHPLDREHEALLPTFVMLRRLLLVAWMGSHSHAQELRRLGPGYTADSVTLARRYLDSAGASLG